MMPAGTVSPPQPDEQQRHAKTVALSWSHFLEHMRLNWEPGQHMALIGPTGEGKTTLALGLLDLRNWVLALDPKGEDDTLSASGYERLRNWPPSSKIRDRIAEGYPARLLVGGPSRTDEEAEELERVLDQAVRGVRAEGGWTLYIDEFQVLSDRRMMGVTTQIEQLLITARTRGTSVVTSFQAPAWVPKASTRQASWCIMWATAAEDSVQTIAEAFGRDWRMLKAQGDELPEYHVLAIPKRHREPMIVTHPPKVG